MRNLIIHTDGGARGNPGPGAIGGVIKSEDGKLLHSFSKYIGEATNNTAEYRAVIEALQEIQKMLNPYDFAQGKRIQRDKIDKIEFFLDSTLVVNQVKGRFKIKQEHLRDLYYTVSELEKEIGIPIEYHAVAREQNAEADKLVNEALDKLQISNIK